ncbi:MAG: hypothetical protein WCK85_11535 [Chlorobium sp.]
MEYERQLIDFHKLGSSNNSNQVVNVPQPICWQYNLMAVSKKTSFNNLLKQFDTLARLSSRSHRATIFRQVS